MFHGAGMLHFMCHLGEPLDVAAGCARGANAALHRGPHASVADAERSSYRDGIQKTSALLASLLQSKGARLPPRRSFSS
jgi:hypothetical protein